MADLAKFKDLLSQAEALDADIKQFEKQKTGLEQDIVSLQAKKQFLETQLADGDAKLQAKRQAQDAQLADIEASIQLKQGAKDTLSASLADMDTKLHIAESTLLTAQQAHEKQIEAMNRELRDKQAELAILEQQRLDVQADIEQLKVQAEQNQQAIEAQQRQQATELESAKAQLADLANQVQDAMIAIQQANKEKVFAEAQLVDVKNAITDAEASLQIVEAKHKEFLEYETRAKKALEAKESALAEQERGLEVRIQTSRRRGVLDNI